MHRVCLPSGFLAEEVRRGIFFDCWTLRWFVLTTLLNQVRLRNTIDSFFKIQFVWINSSSLVKEVYSSTLLCFTSYNTRLLLVHCGIFLPLNLGIVQRRALVGGTAARFLYCTVLPVVYSSPVFIVCFVCTKHYIHSLAHFVTSRYVWLL